MNRARTFLMQHLAQEFSLFRREGADKLVERSSRRGFWEDAAFGNMPSQYGMGRFVHELIDNRLVGVNRLELNLACARTLLRAYRKPPGMTQLAQAQRR